MVDLVTLLRQQSKLGPINVPRAAMRDAADRIEALERQLAEARADVRIGCSNIDREIARAEAAEAERDRLAADLEYWQTVKHSSHWKAQVEAMAPALRQCQKILAVLSRPEGQADISILWAQCVEAEAKARAALAGKE